MSKNKFRLKSLPSLPIHKNKLETGLVSPFRDAVVTREFEDFETRRRLRCLQWQQRHKGRGSEKFTRIALNSLVQQSEHWENFKTRRFLSCEDYKF